VKPKPHKGAVKTAEPENRDYDGDCSLDAFDADLRLDFFFRYNLSILGVFQDRINAHRAPN